jgi:hypothetical protein
VDGGGGELLASNWQPRHAGLTRVTNRTDDVPVELDPGHQLALFGDVPAASAVARAEPSVHGEGSRRSNGHRARLTLGEAARIIREAVKDKSYRSTSLGQLVATYAGSATSTARLHPRSATTKPSSPA